MDTATITKKVTELYIGLLGRAPDTEGLDYWVTLISNNTLTLEDTRNSFANELQPEYWDIYGQLNNRELVIEVYKNFLERDPDDEGLDYWVSQLDIGTIAVGNFFNAIINAVQDTTKAETPDRSIDIKVLENKVAAANYFVEQTATGDGNSSGFKMNAKNAIDGVTSDLTTIDASKLLTLVYAKTLKADEKNTLDGTWQAKDAMGEMTLVFNADGTFIASTYSDQLDPGEINGSEKGTYQWDSNTGDLTITTASDGNGTGGLSQPGIGSKTLNIKANGDDLIVSINQETHTFTPVVANSYNADAVGIFGGHQYLVFSNAKTYEEALIAASQVDSAAASSLVKIDSQEENDFIFNLLKSSNITTSAEDGAGASYAWIGASDAQTEGSWLWVDNSELSYTNWGTKDGVTEPDNFDGSFLGGAYTGQQDAAAIALTDWPVGIAGQWNDVDGVNQLAYIVEIA